MKSMRQEIQDERLKIRARLDLLLYKSNKEKTRDVLMYFGLTAILNAYFHDPTVSLIDEYNTLKNGVDDIVDTEKLVLVEDSQSQLNLFDRQS